MNETLLPFVVSAGLIAFLVFVIYLSKSNEKKRMAIICPNPNCGFKGIGKQDGGTSGCLVMILLCCGILPGILYLLFAGKPGVKCPRCGMKVR